MKTGSSAADIVSSKFEAHALLQAALDRYFEGRSSRIEGLLREQFNLKECFQVQKRYFVKDLARNPVNALWAVPYFSIRKAVEASDKLGWAAGSSFLSKVPQAFKTDFQKETECRLANGLFGLSLRASSDPATDEDQACELTLALEASGLKSKVSAQEWPQLLENAKAEVRSAISEYCLKQNGFTDLTASGGLLITSQILFKDKSLDIFSLGKKLAGRWAHKDAVEHFAFGKKLGHVFYKMAPAPGPTLTQILITTGVVIALLALFSTAITVLSHPLQRKLGFRQKQLEALLETVNGKLLVELSKELKKSNHVAE
jgi:hypothetical protein